MCNFEDTTLIGNQRALYQAILEHCEQFCLEYDVPGFAATYQPCISPIYALELSSRLVRPGGSRFPLAVSGFRLRARLGSPYLAGSQPLTEPDVRFSLIRLLTAAPSESKFIQVIIDSRLR